MNESIELARYYSDNNELKIISIEAYRQLVLDKNKVEIANFIYGRLHSRYIKPFQFSDSVFEKKYKNGFAMMANYCLLIETLVSFKQGWGDSDRKSPNAFIIFFASDDNFKELRDKGSQVYKNIRCGILHQGETTGGWRITRKGTEFYNLESNTIDAVLFSNKIEKSLKDYKEELKKEEWDSEIWDNCRVKIKKIISNCE